MALKSSVVANPVLSITAAKFYADANAFIGRLMAPLFLTGLQAADYYVFDAANFLQVPTNIRRAPGTASSRSFLKLSDDTYHCREYTHEVPVDDRERAKYSNAFDADTAAVRRGTHVLMINHELRVQAKAESAGVPHSGVQTKWDANGADPIGDVDAVKELIRLQCGMAPNRMFISQSVFNVLKELPAILDKIKYTQRGIVTPELLAPVFGVDMVCVAGAVISNSADGQALTPADIWGDNVYLTVTNPSQDLQTINFLRTFAWTQVSGPDGILVTSYRDDPVKSDIHNVAQDMDEKLTGAECGYRLENVLT